MNMRGFYKKYNLNKYEFAYIAEVSHRSLEKFANGEPIRSDTKLRIETAMRVAEKYDLKRPKFNYSESLGFFGISYKNKFHEDVRNYEERFKRLIEEERS